MFDKNPETTTARLKAHVSQERGKHRASGPETLVFVSSAGADPPNPLHRVHRLLRRWLPEPAVRHRRRLLLAGVMAGVALAVALALWWQRPVPETPPALPVAPALQVVLRHECAELLRGDLLVAVGGGNVPSLELAFDAEETQHWECDWYNVPEDPEENSITLRKWVCPIGAGPDEAQGWYEANCIAQHDGVTFDVTSGAYADSGVTAGVFGLAFQVLPSGNCFATDSPLATPVTTRAISWPAATRARSGGTATSGVPR